MMKRKLYWNALNTLAMEIYLEVGLSASLNLKTMRWLDNNPDLVFMNYFAFASLAFLVGYPIWLVVFYLRNQSRWLDEDFQTKFGHPLEATSFKDKPKAKWVPLIFPVVFLLRRLAFIFTVVVIPKFNWM